jgi:hypothetical protein
MSSSPKPSPPSERTSVVSTPWRLDALCCEPVYATGIFYPARGANTAETPRRVPAVPRRRRASDPGATSDHALPDARHPGTRNEDNPEGPVAIRRTIACKSSRRSPPDLTSLRLARTSTPMPTESMNVTPARIVPQVSRRRRVNLTGNVHDGLAVCCRHRDLQRRHALHIPRSRSTRTASVANPRRASHPRGRLCV